MRVILLKDIQGTGKKGDEKDVADGFGRNFLLKNKFAMLATSAAREQHAAEIARKEKMKLMEEKGERHTISFLQGKEVEMTAKINEEGRLYAAITPKKVAEQIQRQFNISIDPQSIVLEEPIKEIGDHRAEIDLGSGLSATFSVIVSEG